MTQEVFFNTHIAIVIGGGALLVFVFTSLIHHLVGKITKWWDPRWASFFLSIIAGAVIHTPYIEVLEPSHVVFIIIDILLIYFTAVGYNTVIGSPIMVLEPPVQTEPKGKRQQDSHETALIFALRENWRTRWFN